MLGCTTKNIHKKVNILLYNNFINESLDQSFVLPYLFQMFEAEFCIKKTHKRMLVLYIYGLKRRYQINMCVCAILLSYQYYICISFLQIDIVVNQTFKIISYPKNGRSIQTKLTILN